MPACLGRPDAFDAGDAVVHGDAARRALRGLPRRRSPASGHSRTRSGWAPDRTPAPRPSAASPAGRHRAAGRAVGVEVGDDEQVLRRWRMASTRWSTMASMPAKQPGRGQPGQGTVQFIRRVQATSLIDALQQRRQLCEVVTLAFGARAADDHFLDGMMRHGSMAGLTRLRSAACSGVEVRNR